MFLSARAAGRGLGPSGAGGRARRVCGCVPFLLALALVPCAAGPAAAAAPPSTDAVLVMPFDADASQARTYWLGEGASILITDALVQRAVAALSRDQRAQIFEDLHLPSTGSLSRATVIRVAQLVGAAHVVFGTVALDEATIQVSARRLDVAEGRLDAEVVERGPASEMLAVCRRLAARLAPSLGEPTPAVAPPGDGGAAGTDEAAATREAAATGDTAPTGDADDVPLEAFETYVKGVLADLPETRERLFRAALERAPAYDRALLGLWHVHTEQGHHQAALDAARAVPESSPRWARARFGAALSLVHLREYDQAYDVLSGLSTARPAAPVFNNLGVLQLRRGASAHAGLPVAFFNRAAEVDPDDPDFFFNLGYAYLLDRQPKTAVYWLQQAVRRAPADGLAHYVLAAALSASGATAEAARERDLARGLSSAHEEWDRARQPGDVVPRGLERVKTSLDAVHTVRFDRELMSTAQRNQREMAAFYVERAQRLYEQHKDGEAAGELRRALFLAPYDSTALLLLARIHLRTGHARDAADVARVALWSEGTAAAHVVLAEALLELKDADGARAEVERALALEPASPDARALLARVGPGSR